jgi:DNA ligase-1
MSQKLRASLDKAVARGKLAESDRDAAVNRVAWSTELDDLADVEGFLVRVLEPALMPAATARWQGPFQVSVLDGRPLLDEPLTARRKLLEGLGLEHPYLLARLEEATDPAHLDRIFAETRERGNEGLMVKDPQSPYTPGRRGLAWLKLKRPLATLDVVVTAVEWGHGKRRGVLSDYTFAVKDTASGRLVNVGKAYSGLTDAEIARFTKHFLEITVQDQGYRRMVTPEVVLEVAFDSIQHSGRHLSGYALRFPRIVRIRDDKPVDEIDTVERVAELYDRYFGEKSEVSLSEVAQT